MRVAGASQFINTAILNNRNGVDALSAQSGPSLLGGFDATVSLLEIGKQNAAPGIGLSRRARAFTSQFLQQSQSGTNIILSAGAQNAIEGANLQIKALQARLPKSMIGSYSGRYNQDGETASNPYNTLGNNVSKKV